jgi:hypothetical protein
MGAFPALRGNTAPNEYLGRLQCRREPTIEPGQIWLVECEDGSFSAFHAGLLARANVVLYERALSASVADSLPIGVYAEPLPAVGAAGPAIAPRALQFAADGWSVLQLVEMRPDWRQLLQFATEALNGPGTHGSSLLAIGTITASRYRSIRDRQQRGNATDIAILAAELGPDELLSLIFGSPGTPPGPGRPAQGQVFTANGLAG